VPISSSTSARRNALSATFVSLLLLSCAPEIVSGVPFGLKERQISYDWHTSPPRRQLWTLFIDDAPTEDARALRAQVAAEVPGILDKLQQGCTGGRDPAVFEAKTLDVLIVPLSNPAAALHPVNHPELGLVTPNVSSTNNAAWETAVASAIQTLESPTETPADILGALAYWDALIAGTTEADDPQTATFLEALLDEPYSRVMLATSRDQEVTTTPVPRLRHLVEVTALLSNSAICALPETSRAAPGLEPLRHIVRFCEEELLAHGASCSQFSPVCLPGHPATNPTGEVRCRVMAELDDNSSCPTSAGWENPRDEFGMRQARVIKNAPTEREPNPPEHRLCEVVPLESTAKASCEQDVNCPDCAPGWCFREPFSLDVAEWDWRGRECADEGSWTLGQIRLVHGSNQPKAATLTVTCDLE
jgi:hypothetical protein